MTNRAIAAVVATALAVGGGVALIATAGSDDSNAEVHRMQDGTSHTGAMPKESHTMDNGDVMGEPSGGRMKGMSH